MFRDTNYTNFTEELHNFGSSRGIIIIIIIIQDDTYGTYGTLRQMEMSAINSKRNKGEEFVFFYLDLPWR
jgi:hypothetical protein